MNRLFVGLYSGPSALGVDAALVRVHGVGADITFNLEHFLHVPYSPDLRALVRRAAGTGAVDVRTLGTLHRALGENYALAVRQLLEQARQAAPATWAIGCSGQTIWHDADGRFPAALDLGMTAVLAERTGLTAVADFASRDLALGGQGSPLSAIVVSRLFRHARECRAHLHLGSIASLVYLPANERLLGFEAAPATMLLDGLMHLLTNGREPFDAGGKHAVQGRCLDPLLERWMQNHFLQQRPPKCVPRHEYGADFLLRAIDQAKRLDGTLHDTLCTMTHFVARSVAHAVHAYLPAAPMRILLSGRGVRNGLLWHLLEQRLQPIVVEKTDAHGVPAEAVHAVAHAGLAALTLDGVPTNLPSVTGASGQRVLGQVAPGSSANWSRCLAWMARMSEPARALAA
jgi:anhydro-N-acetylmuramic acid kinase